MTETVIRVGDTVTWTNRRLRKERPNIVELIVPGCTVERFYDVSGPRRAVAVLKCGPPFGIVHAFVDDLELEGSANG